MFKRRARKEEHIKQHSFDYQMLSRLKMDCNYFLGNGNGYERHLWAGNVDSQIAEMKRIYNGLRYKPRWLKMRHIKAYEKKMKNYQIK